MNWDKMCPGCMHELTEEDCMLEKCPHCDFEKEKEERGQALPVLTILSGKYLIGKILEKDSKSITYLAYDLNLEIKIQITEYFPTILVKRDDDKRTVIPISDENKEAYEQGKKNDLENARQIVKLVTRSGAENLIRDFFEENNTVYTVLIDKEMPSVTAMPQDLEEKKETGNRKSKIVFFSILGAVVLLAGILGFIFLSFHNRNFKVDKEWEAAYKSDMLGTSYDEDIVIFATDSGLYYAEYDENGELPQAYWLAECNVNESMYCVDTDEEYLYVSVTNYGIFRANIQEEKVKYEQIIPRNTLEFILHDKYIYYVEDEMLYRAKKDGSDECLLAKNATQIFTLYKNSLFYYSVEDACIYRVDEKGDELVKVMEMQGVENILAVKSYLYVVQKGGLCRINLETSEVEEILESGTIGGDSEIYVKDDVIYFVSLDNKGLVSYQISDKKQKVLYNGDEISMTGMMEENLFLLNSKGQYYCIDTDNYTMKTMQFNYLSMSENAIREE